MPDATDQPIWTPSAERIATANITAFRRAAAARWGLDLPDQDRLHDWSVASPEQFWVSVWEDGGVIGERGERVLLDAERMPGARWFPDARLNYAENLLRRRDAADAVVFWGEDRVQRRLSHAELHLAVARLAAALRGLGVEPGDRVAAYLPNLPETLIALLATASLGAIFTSASPDFGVQGVLDRFGQVQPKVLIASDGYFYAGKTIDCLHKLADIVAQLPTLRRVLVVPYVQSDPDLSAIDRAETFAVFVAPYRETTEIRFEPLPFDHPLFIVYSSGTTGVPKCILHGAGGILLQHIKEHRLHCDIKPGDRVFYYTTCGWMMWNWLMSGLASGATLLLYDGSPFAGDGRILFDYADAEDMTHFGTSAKFLDAAAKQGLEPRATHRLQALRVMTSTGSPLMPEGFDYVHARIKPDLQLASISGGTDILSCFVLGNPALPVWRGEIQCRGLGMAVDVWDDDGNPLRGAKGELVCTRPFPSMPIGFWSDPDGSRYRAAYFERFPGVWCHGDFCEITPHGGLVIHGRSDATLNPGGVRIGTAEIYRQVERLEAVVESLVIAQDWPPERPTDVRLVLFVKLREGLELDEALAERIRRTIRDNATARHVPARIIQVPDMPRTRSGKLVELAVRNLVHGRAVSNREALANPEVLAHFRDRAELAS